MNRRFKRLKHRDIVTSNGKTLRRSKIGGDPGWERTKAELEVERGSGNVGYLAEAERRRGRWTVARAHRIRARLALGISLAPLSHRISCRLRNARRLVPLPNCLLSLPRHFHFPSSMFQEARLTGRAIFFSNYLRRLFFKNVGSLRIRNATDRAYSS